jgi:hypothetical protein
MTKLTIFVGWCLLGCLLAGELVQGWIPSSIPSRGFSTKSRQTTVLRLQDRRVVDNGDFFRERQDEFLRFENSDEEYGPGPALIFYNVPQGVLDHQLVDILRDNAPSAIRKGVSLSRMDSSTSSEWMELSLKDALEKVVLNTKNPHYQESPDPLTTDAGILATTPVLFYSGFRNSEMLMTFNVISHAVHKETMGRLTVASAVAYPDTMDKPLRQVLMEIAGEYETVKPTARKV